MQKRIFSWTYPNDREELVQVLMVSLGLLFIILVVVAARYNSYKNRVLDKENIEQAYLSLESFSQESSQVLQDSQKGKITNNFREVYSDQIAEQVDTVVTYISSRPVQKEQKTTRKQVLDYGTELTSLLQQTSKATISENDVELLQKKIEKLNDKLQAVEENL